jgi:hypothetical protein
MGKKEDKNARVSEIDIRLTAVVFRETEKKGEEAVCQIKSSRNDVD